MTDGKMNISSVVDTALQPWRRDYKQIFFKALFLRADLDGLERNSRQDICRVELYINI